MAVVYLRKRPGRLWYIVDAGGRIITGPHRWGNAEEAMRAAQNFCGAWQWQVHLEDDKNERSSSKDPVPSSDEQS